MMTWSRAFVLKARAKLNLTLRVGSIQPNGLHEVRSITASLSVADEVRFEPYDGRFAVECDAQGTPESENLAFRAASALAGDFGGVRIRIAKRIPVQAGLGGGSADAAAAIRGLARISSERGVRDYLDEELFSAGASLGSDVAACLLSGFVRVKGTGEIVQSLPVTVPPWGVVLLKPAAGMATSQAYELFDEQTRSSQQHAEPIDSRDDSEAIVACLQTRDYRALCENVGNDFDPVVCRALTDVARAHERLRSAGADATLMCGSGSTVAGFFPTVLDAQAAVARIELQSGEWTSAAGFAVGE